MKKTKALDPEITALCETFEISRVKAIQWRRTCKNSGRDIWAYGARRKYGVSRPTPKTIEDSVRIKGTTYFHLDKDKGKWRKAYSFEAERYACDK